MNFGMALTQPICDAILSTRLRFPASRMGTTHSFAGDLLMVEPWFNGKNPGLIMG